MHRDFKNHPRRTGLFGALLSIIRNLLLWILPKKLFIKDVSRDTVLITGAGAGLGRALAMEFAKLGSSLVLWDINKAALDETKKLVGKNRVNEGSMENEPEPVCLTYLVDVSNYEQVVDTTKQMKIDLSATYAKRYVSILINNAGIFSTKSILDIEPSAIEKIFQVNVFSHFWLIKLLLPEMIQHKKGHIVEIGSFGGLASAPNVICYNSSKHAVVGLEKCLSSELSYQGLNEYIKTTCVCPSFFSSCLYTGYQPISFVPLLSLEFVTQETMMSILCNESLVLIPRYIPMFVFRYFNRDFLHYLQNCLGLGDMTRDVRTSYEKERS